MFCVVTYNIFARSLGSTCIPWVMHVSEEWRAVIERHVEPLSYSDWVKSILTEEYKCHFHKNYFSGNKNEMRALWSRNVRCADDIASNLQGIRFVCEDQVQYIANGKVLVATTLHGLIARSIPAELATALYAHIVRDEHHFRWDIRGPKIYRSVTGEIPEFGRSPDIVVLTEYDVHDGAADYRGTGVHETFPMAMRHAGYSGALMQAPLEKELSGLGLFWKPDAFELAPSATSLDEDVNSCDESGSVQINVGTCYRGATNFDLHEYSHKLSTGAEGHISSTITEFPIADRKNAFFARLRHLSTGKIVLVVGLHLMTDSRDCADTNEFPGQVRGQELNAIGDILRNHSEITDKIDAILVMGDFNIDVSERDIFKGIVKSCLSDAVLHIQTRFREDGPLDQPILDLNIGRPHPALPHFRLVESFADVHKWREATEVEACSSFNSRRRSWIDLVWYSNSSLQLQMKRTITPLTDPIPNEEHGSDHLPLFVLFEFL